MLEQILHELVEMYTQELFSKSLIVEDLLNAPTSDVNVATVYIAAWQMQPWLEKNRLEEIMGLITFELLHPK
jgi:hypothetical protein